MITKIRVLLAIALSAIGLSAHAAALQPYVLAYSSTAMLDAEAVKVRDRLRAGGYTVIGEYSPYAGALVVAVSSPALLAAASKDPFGGYAAVQHVALTTVGSQVQVSYLNPDYLAAAYRLSVSLAEVSASLKTVLGAQQTFGTEKGRSDKQLREFKYMVGMEQFDDPYELGSHASYAEAVKTVEDNLRKKLGGAALVYKIGIPGKQQTVFGVSRASASDRNANDKHIMADTVDPNFPLKTTAYLPYQMMVNGKDVLAPHMRFRMAVWHPDLTMVTFGKLMASPGAIEKLLAQIAAGRKEASAF